MKFSEQKVDFVLPDRDLGENDNNLRRGEAQLAAGAGKQEPEAAETSF